MDEVGKKKETRNGDFVKKKKERENRRNLQKEVGLFKIYINGVSTVCILSFRTTNLLSNLSFNINCVHYFLKGPILKIII